MQTCTGPERNEKLPSKRRRGQTWTRTMTLSCTTHAVRAVEALVGFHPVPQSCPAPLSSSPHSLPKMLPGFSRPRLGTRRSDGGSTRGGDSVSRQNMDREEEVPVAESLHACGDCHPESLSVRQTRLRESCVKPKRKQDREAGSGIEGRREKEGGRGCIRLFCWTSKGVSSK